MITLTWPISIHVLRVEDDVKIVLLMSRVTYFNPRPPCGGRRVYFRIWRKAGEFQSTSSVWRTTVMVCFLTISIFISIHVLRVEDDNGACFKRGY